jgi:hypothetical protein
VESYKPSGKGSANSISVTFDLVDRRKSKLSEDVPFNLNSPNTNMFLPSHGRWLRRRKNDGALNRVPPIFYPKVWTVLSQCEGISIANEWLGTGVTKEKTAEEFNLYVRRC